MTEPEIMLWSRLKGRKEGKPIFRRQYAYETLIFDFFCPAADLAVEIDGAEHGDEDRQAKDEGRDHWLRRRGIDVVRVPASEVYRDLNGVADGVIRVAEARSCSRRSGD